MEIIEEFNILATAFEENLGIGNAYKDAYTETIAMIKRLHKQLNDLVSKNSTTTHSVTSTVGVGNPTPSPVQKIYKLDSNTNPFAGAPAEDLENWIFLIMDALRLAGVPDDHILMVISPYDVALYDVSYLLMTLL